LKLACAGRRVRFIPKPESHELGRTAPPNVVRLTVASPCAKWNILAALPRIGQKAFVMPAP
jgi:hypothetical protein